MGKGKGKGKEGSSDIGSRLSPPPRLGSAAIHPMNIDQERVEGRRENRREEKRRWFPWLVPVFVIANVVLFVITMYVNNCPETMENCVGTFLGRFSFQPVKENPLLGPSSTTLEKMGALEVSKVVQQHQGWRLISCIWLHAGVVHIAANMLSLLLIGIRLEQEFGFFRVGVVYILAGLGGSLLSALFIQSSISVGASGALFGLLGAMLSELITNWTIYSNKFVTMTVLVLLIVVNLAVGILPHVDNFAHIGGFISGFLLGFVFLIQPQYGWVSKKHVPPGYDLPRQSSKHKSYQYIYFATALVLLIAGFVTAFVLLFGGFNANDHCSWCHYLSCVPTPAWNCKAQNITCSSTTLGNQITLTCDSNGRVKTYAADSNPNLTQLCIQLCT